MKRILLYAVGVLFLIGLMGAVDNTAQTPIQQTDFVTVSGSGNVPSYTKIDNYALTSATSITTTAVDIGNAKSVYFAISAEDTGVVLISYQLSVDGTNYGAATLKDSLVSVPGTAAATLKVVDFSTIATGGSFIKFVLAGSNKQHGTAFAATQMSAVVKRFSN